MDSIKINKLTIKTDVRTARFLVDLKKNLAEEAAAGKTKAQTAQNLETKLESGLEKLAEVDYGKYFNAGREKAGELFSLLGLKIRLALKHAKGSTVLRDYGAKHASQAWLHSASRAKHGSELEIEPYVSIFDQLAFVALVKSIYWLCKKILKLLEKICYGFGWTIMFVLRLIWLILAAIIRPLVRKINYLFIRWQLIFNKFLRDLPVGYQATQTVAMAVSARLLARLKHSWQKLVLAIKQKTIPPTPLYQGGNHLPAISTMSAGQALSKERGKYNPPYQGGVVGYLKPVVIFAGVLLLIVLPVKAYTYYKSLDSIKGKVLGASEQALDDLISGGQAAAKLDFLQAGQSFTRASDNFLSAQKQLEEINGLIFALAAVAPNQASQLAAASRNIIKAGNLSAAAGKNLSLALASLFDNKNEDILKVLANLSSYGHQAAADLASLNQELKIINSQAIPEIRQKEFILLKQKTGELLDGLNEFIGLADSLKNFLGFSADKRYLLIFQNNAELRASGGFIGSFALIDFAKGKIKNLEVPGGGSYDTDAGLLKKIKAPEPLRLVRPDWHFWDANWWPDWPTSARKLAWFYENSDGATVDGVIGFTPAVMEKILKVIGPVDMRKEYGLIIDADNFWLETQKLSEQKPDATKQPKKIIGDLMNQAVEELPKRLAKTNLIPLLKVIEESLSDKNILFYFTDESLQAKAAEMDWAGKIKDTAGDYLNVINTNIAGGKSDRKIKQEIILETQIQSDGAIIDNLTIKRTHQAVRREPFSGVRNVDWLRVYVPFGSKLIEASGFKPVDKIFFKPAEASWQNDPEVYLAESQAQTHELSGVKIYNEFNKTVFANWTQLDPGQAIEINIRYQLPFKITDKKFSASNELYDQLMAKASEFLQVNNKNYYPYSLLAQKQPGMNSSLLISQLKLSENFKPVWHSPADLAVNQNGWFRSENLEQDKIMAVLLEEK